MDLVRFDLLADYSAKLHGHKYVFPVAVWLCEHEDDGVFSQPEIRRGLVHAESNRIFEALDRLIALDALIELPKLSGRRCFERKPNHPYWDFVQAELLVLDS